MVGFIVFRRVRAVQRAAALERELLKRRRTKRPSAPRSPAGDSRAADQDEAGASKPSRRPSWDAREAKLPSPRFPGTSSWAHRQPARPLRSSNPGSPSPRRGPAARRFKVRPARRTAIGGSRRRPSCSTPRAASPPTTTTRGVVRVPRHHQALPTRRPLDGVIVALSSAEVLGRRTCYRQRRADRRPCRQTSHPGRRNHDATRDWSCRST